MRGDAVSNSPVLLLLLIAYLLLVPEVPAAQEPTSTGNEETSFYTETPTFALAPATPYTEEIASSVKQLNPRLGLEARFFLPLPKEVLRSSDFELRLYNILRSVSTMEGIEYYSASREQMRTFYEESYAVAGPEGDRRIPDPLVDTIPRQDRLYVFQKDSSFGKNVQQLDYTFGGENVLVRMENMTTMFYNGLIPLVSDGNLLTFLVVHPEDRGVIFYGHLAVRVGALFGMEERAQQSFYNRVKALYDWFNSRVDEEFSL